MSALQTFRDGVSLPWKKIGGWIVLTACAGLLVGVPYAVGGLKALVTVLGAGAFIVGGAWALHTVFDK